MSKNKVCDICLSKPGSNHVSLAAMSCKSCEQNICNGCLQYHERFNATSGHALQPLPPTENITTCYHEHLHFCGNHKHFCCEQCREDFHANCDNMSSIQDFLKREKQMITVNNKMHKKLLEMKLTVEEDFKFTEKKEREWIERMDKLLKDLHEAAAELEEKVNMKIEYVKSNMERRKDDNKTKMNHLQNAIKDIERNIGIIQDKTNTGNMKVKTMDKMNEHFKEYTDLLNSDPKEYQVAFLKADHDFEAKHYVSGTMQRGYEIVKSINKIYSEIQQYIFHADHDVSLSTEFTSSSDAFQTIKDQTNVTLAYLKTESENHHSGHERKRAQSESMIPTSTLSTQLDTEPTDTVTVRKRYYSDSKELKPDSSTTYFKGSRNMQKETSQKNVNTGTRIPASSHADFPIQSSRRESLELYERIAERKESDSVPEIAVQSHCKIKVRLEEDSSTCGITGISMLNNGYWIMADFLNLKLKVFAPCGDFKAKLPCEDKPRDIAKLENDEFAVTFPMAKRIQIVSVQTDSNAEEMSIIMGEKIETHAKCCGIAFHNGKIYVATQVPHQILIIKDGVIENTISGDNLFERATYIAVEPETSLIYISDPSKVSVLGIDEQRELKFSYKVEQPHSVATAGQGRIFVADWEQETVHLVDKNGEKIGVLKLDKCHCPQKLMFHKKENLLLVSRWMEDMLHAVRLKVL